jgi:quinol monooxygenase YgiN
MSQSAFPIYLLSIRGTLAPANLEAARQVHNQTAGNPQGVATARALGDLSHMVYVPVHSHNGDKEFLILDQWNNLEGLNQFFADPQVQQGGHMIFTQRDPVVWAPAEGFHSYHFPAPYGQNDRFVAVVRGPVASHEQAKAVHNEIVSKNVNKARMAGDLSHEAYFRLAQPGTPESLEFFAVDVWTNAEKMAAYYEDPEFTSGFEKLFAGEPWAAMFVHPEGEWVEW